MREEKMLTGTSIHAIIDITALFLRRRCLNPLLLHTITFFLTWQETLLPLPHLIVHYSIRQDLDLEGQCHVVEPAERGG